MKMRFAIMIYLTSLIQPIMAMTITVPADATQFQVQLAANPTTGYQWAITKWDKALLTVVSKQYIAPKKQLIGAGGNMVFTLQLIKGVTVPKTTQLEFNYARPWESNKLGKSQMITVNFK